MTLQPLPHRALSALVHAHKGRPAIVMGGGPSLPFHMQQLRDVREAVCISANDHGLRPGLAEPAPVVGYIAACDDIEKRLRPWGVPIIAPRHWADYRVLHGTMVSSGILACIAAWVMGCAPIIIAGIDLYRGPTYWHDAKAESPGKSIPSVQHMKRWELLPSYCPGAMFRAMGGPLAERFKPYIRHEMPEPIATTRQVLAIIGGTFVEITKVCPWYGTTYEPGEIVEVKTPEAGLLIARGFARSRRRGQDSEIIEFDEYG